MIAVWSSSAHTDAWVAETRRLIAEDRVYYVIVGLFVLCAGVTAAAVGRDYVVFTVFGYVRSWAILAVGGITAALSPRFIVRAWRERPAHPLVLARDILLEFLAPAAAAGLALYLALAAFMGAFTTMKTVLPCLNGFWADPWLARIDRAVHFGQQPWRWIQPLLGFPPVTRLIEIVYEPVWIGCIMLVPLYFCVTRRHPEHRRRFLIGFMLTWIINGIVLAGLFMSGGPAFYGRITHDNGPFGDLVRYLSFDADTALSAAWTQRELWQAYRAASSGVGVGISAFPSLHVSMIVLCCLGMWKISRPVAYALVAVAAVIVVGSVHLGWHYAVGNYVVFVLIGAIWWASGRLAVAPRRIPEPWGVRSSGDRPRGAVAALRVAETDG
ncbi:MAG TPA: phosphatase PAP2 family protein [Lichenihabitans sp.]|jgi:hypothetical protein|nr:phosphatase PAP2 family protein [Lichenihabitans sp.]